jgi:hypothetical protein
MRKIYLIVVILALASCQDTYIGNDFQPTASQCDYNSAEQEAIQIASSAASVFFDQSRSVRTITSAKAVTPIYSSSSSRTDGEDPIIYAVDYDDNQGFAVVSARNTENQLLGVFESGSYEDALENPSFEYYISSASTFVLRDTIVNPISKEFTVLMSENKSKAKTPKIQVRWGQGNPYGMYCPNKISGCTNTAMAQVMTYYKYPTKLKLTYDGAPSDSISLDWDEITKHTITTSNNESDTTCCGSMQAHIMIATLIRELGERAGSSYLTDGQGTATSDYMIKYVLSGLGYSTTSLANYYSGVEYDELDNGILIVRGTVSGENYGHAWVVDGYKYIVKLLIDRSTKKIIRELDSNHHYAHVNWGWNGTGNGYYLSNVFDTNAPYKLDSGCSSTSNGYYSDNVKYLVVSH